MTRLSRKNQPITVKNTGNGIADLLDLCFMETWRITEEQYDFVCKNATEEELDALCSPVKSVEETKKGLLIIEKLLKQMKNEK
jgi:hypothetical protein